MELAVIILNWNAADDTICCVRRVTAWEQVRPTVWVVDNSSTDGSARAILRACPAVRLIQNEVNLGFAGGNNRGIAAALAAGDAPILLLNNDALIEEKSVIRLLRSLQENQRIGFIGPLLFDAEDRDRLLAAGGRNPVLHHHSHIPTPPATGPIYPVEYIPGTVLLARADVFRSVGLLDEDYFFSMEVADLCMRARRRGYVSAIDRRARAFHALGRSSALRETLYAYYIVRNRFLFIRKFYPRSSPSLFAAWSLYSVALWLKLRAVGKLPSARAVWLGLVDGLRGRFGGQNERVLPLIQGGQG